jgi:hypothetical protein
MRNIALQNLGAVRSQPLCAGARDQPSVGSVDPHAKQIQPVADTLRASIQNSHHDLDEPARVVGFMEREQKLLAGCSSFRVQSLAPDCNPRYDAVVATRRENIRRFAESLLGHGRFRIAVEPLHGGLEAAGVSLVGVRAADGSLLTSFVMKPMEGTGLREYRVHRALQQLRCAGTAPRLLGAEPEASDRLLVFLEWVPAADPWPWHKREHAMEVLTQLARVHRCDPGRLPRCFTDWNYDQELEHSARATVRLYRDLSRSGLRVGKRPMQRPLERVAACVIAMRRQAVRYTGAALLHGDVHPGNTVMRESNGVLRAILLDWARARRGSPLEDVMSWLHSLGFWEPNARRLHDSLLVYYRRACGLSDGLTPDFRAACWLAGACNAMAGALRYHLAIAADATRDPGTRWTSSNAAADWLRIIRRADAVWTA